jgi:hypothetical protein
MSAASVGRRERTSNLVGESGVVHSREPSCRSGDELNKDYVGLAESALRMCAALVGHLDGDGWMSETCGIGRQARQWGTADHIPIWLRGPLLR